MVKYASDYPRFRTHDDRHPTMLFFHYYYCYKKDWLNTDLNSEKYRLFLSSICTNLPADIVPRSPSTKDDVSAHKIPSCVRTCSKPASTFKKKKNRRHASRSAQICSCTSTNLWTLIRNARFAM